jgi:hypothetical protein
LQAGRLEGWDAGRLEGVKDGKRKAQWVHANVAMGFKAFKLPRLPAAFWLLVRGRLSY